MEKAKNYYKDLFDFKKNIAGKGHGTLFNHIVTTNYDLVLELCAQENADIPYRTGFERDTKSEERYLPLREMILENKSPGIEYLKLHGSINWWIRDSDKCVIERNESQSSTSLMGENYNEQLMIYPIYEKYVSQDPYFSLYYYFRKLLYYHDKYLVIGYSFRDPSINNAFADALKNNNSARMIIVNCNKNIIEKRTKSIFPAEKVDVVKTSFGDNRLFTELEDVLI
jgi:hypothetical protein